MGYRAEWRCVLTAGGLGAGFFAGGASTTGSSGDGAFAEALGGAFLAGALGALAGGARAGAAPALHLTVAFSNASFTFAFRTSAIVSMIAFRGLSPTIFIKQPKQVAASLRAPSNPSSSKVARVSERGLICAGGIGEVAVDNDRPKNFNVPSFIWGFLSLSDGSRSGRMSARETYS